MNTDMEKEAFEAAVAAVNERGWTTSTDLARQIWDSSAAWQRAQSAPVVPEGYAIVPVTATAENGAKAALLGEFSIANETICTGCYYGEADDDCEVCGGETHYIEHVTVPWDTIKEIYAEAVRVLAAAPQPGKE